MKPSPYFADTFRYFFMRFRSRESLFRWFVRRAGDSSEPFRYPIDFRSLRGLLVILPELPDEIFAYSTFLKTLEKLRIPGTLLLANKRSEEPLEKLGVRTETLYYTGAGCRYGESEFQKIRAILRERHFTASLYLEPKHIFQLLYLAKDCGAAYRFGFSSEELFPLLNLSLVAGNASESRAEFLTGLLAGTPK